MASMNDVNQNKQNVFPPIQNQQNSKLNNNLLIKNIVNSQYP